MSSAFSGSEFRRLRRSANLTQAQVCEGLISTAYLSLIERGHRHPTAALAQELMVRVGKSPRDLDQTRRIRDSHAYVTELAARGELAQAQDVLATLRADIPDSADDPLVMLASAEIDYAAGMRDLALEAALKAADKLERGSEDRARCLLVACWSGREIGLIERALAAAEEELGHHVGGQQSATVASLRGTCAAELGTLGQTERALQVARGDGEFTDAWSRATSLWSQSDILRHSGDNLGALALAREALAEAEASGHKVGCAVLRNTIAWILPFTDLFDADEVTSLLDSAEAFFRETADTDRLMNLHGARALLHAKVGDNRTAIELSQHRLANTPAPDHSRRASILLWLGRYHRADGDIPAALAALDAAVDELRSADNKHLHARVWHEMSIVYESLGELQRAVECLKECASAKGINGGIAEEMRLLSR